LTIARCAAFAPGRLQISSRPAEVRSQRSDAMGSASETINRIRTIAAGAVSAIQRAATAEELEALRIKYLGRKGEIMLLTRSMGEVAAEDRPAVGAAVNDAKNAAQAALDARKTELEQSAGPKRAAGAIDVTLPGTRRPVGRRHPLSQVDEQIKSI